ncbi:MAG: DNA/RNA non-specific endonuclease [Bacteroidales bacterium]|nr:DNA/RNA non-specific endonuclease [Bacteroidales bacterium]
MNYRKTIFLIFLSLFAPLFLLAQYKDIVKIENTYYTSWFSASARIPELVSYSLTKEMLSCSKPVKRTNRFKPDPKFSNITNIGRSYKKSGYDRGHNMSAENNKCNLSAMNECFYYSNMTPQPHSFNAGKWKDLEMLERKEAEKKGKIIVTIGSIGKTAAIGDDSVVVPQFMWKVIYIPSEKTYKCWYFPNKAEKGKVLDDYKSTLQSIEKNANLTFKDGIVTK